jgi:ABC-type Zn uptake system ZnuABC Zn-binding protein ZnuA
MDPHNVIYWVLMIRDALSAADPDHAASYAANAEAYAQELVALESDFIMPALEAVPAENRVLVTSHESLGYFATTFGFEIITTVVPGSATMVEPSARDIAALIDRINAEGVPAMFSDTQVSDAIVRTIASAVGIEIFGLYSDTLTGSDGPASTYLDYMRYNVTTIVDALKG